MTKQQLREAIRRIIKSELNEGLYMSPAQAGYLEGYNDGKEGKPFNMNYGKGLKEALYMSPAQAGYLEGYSDGEAGKPFNMNYGKGLKEALYMSPAQAGYLEGYSDGKEGKPFNMEYGKNLEEGEKTTSNPNAGKWRIVTSDKEKPLTDKFYDSKAEAEAASKKIGQINAPGMKIIQLKDTMKVFAKENKPAQAPSKPSTAPGVKERPATPDKKEPRRPLGNPNTGPVPAKAKAKATMKEAEMLKQVIKRFKSKK